MQSTPWWFVMIMVGLYIIILDGLVQHIYKKTGGQSCLKAENEFFNNKLSSAQIKSEHCIGLIKNRFPCLRGLNVRIKKP